MIPERGKKEVELKCVFLLDLVAILSQICTPKSKHDRGSGSTHPGKGAILHALVSQ